MSLRLVKLPVKQSPSGQTGSTPVSGTMQIDQPQEIVREIHEHEVLLSFNSDMDAAKFDEWFNGEGKLLFEDWAKEN